jgi:hypothetical protein
VNKKPKIQKIALLSHVIKDGEVKTSEFYENHGQEMGFFPPFKKERETYYQLCL